MVSGSSLAAASLPLPLQSDLENVLDFVNELRIRYTPSGTRQPMTFERCERRTSARIPLQVPICVTPVNLDADCVRADPRFADSIWAMTRDLSLKGIGFVHDRSFPYRNAIVTFEIPTQAPLSLVVAINWTRLYKNGKHRTGARFRSLIKTPESLRQA